MAETEPKTVAFHNIAIGSRFKYHEHTYEKTRQSGSSCCNKKFNSINMDLEKPKIFGRNDQVIPIEQND